MEFNMLQLFTILNRFNNNNVTYSTIRLVICSLQLNSIWVTDFILEIRKLILREIRWYFFLFLKKKTFLFCIGIYPINNMWQF